MVEQSCSSACSVLPCFISSHASSLLIVVSLLNSLSLTHTHTHTLGLKIRKHKQKTKKNNLSLLACLPLKTQHVFFFFFARSSATSPINFTHQKEKLKVEYCKATEKQNSDKEDHNMILLRSCVKKLHFGSWEEKEEAAKEIEMLAKEDVKFRKLMTELGVVPVLGSMAASEVPSRRRVGVKALIQLANDTCMNKALILDAGILSKLPKRIDLEDESTISEFANLLSSLSSLSNIQFPHASLNFLPLLGDILKSCSRFDTKQSCLVALCNISAVLENAGPLVSNEVVPILLELSSTKEISEKALATLGNLVVTSMGKKSIENSSMVPECLIEILSWEDKPKCQELSSYILMVLAHQSSSQRDKMVQLGIVPILLEVALLGSALAQKRALKLLQWFKYERHLKMAPHSGPQTLRTAIGLPINHREAKEGKRMMKNLVKESLHRNMETITQRANAVEESAKLKSLFINTSSRSLPY